MAAPRLLREDVGSLIAGQILVAAPNDLYAVLLEQNKLAVQNGEAPPQQVPFIAAQIAISPPGLRSTDIPTCA